MTILVAYVARPEGRAALDKGIEIATRRNEPLVVVNAGPGGHQEDPALISGYVDNGADGAKERTL